MTNKPLNPLKGALTPYKPGSMAEAWRLIYPMILTSMSMSLMMFADRIILAMYSTKAMTAAACAGTIVFTISVSLIGITGITEVFIGQHNGAQEYKRVGEVVWQMLWFSLMSLFLCLPLAHYGAAYLVADPYDNLGVPYFQWLMYFTPLVPGSVALASFFVGLGMPRVVTLVTVISNLLNVGLDFGLILGIDGYIAPLGTKGAAIATNISKGFEVLVLGALFLRKKYHLKYNTRDFRLRLKPLWACLKIGTPSSVSHVLEISAWAVQMHLMARVSEVHVTVLAVGQTIFMLFLFITDGQCKGIGALASNYMGSNQQGVIPKIFAASIKIHFLFMGALLIVFCLFNKELVDALLEGDYPPRVMETIIYYSRMSLIFVAGFLIFDGINWIIIGILTASGDTKFVMACNGLNSWFLGILPLMLVVTYFDPSPLAAWSTNLLYAGGCFLTLLWRYKTGTWRINRIRPKS